MEKEQPAKRICAAVRCGSKKIFRRIYGFLSLVGLRTAGAAAAFYGLLRAGVARLGGAGKSRRERVMTLINYVGPIVAAAALVVTVGFWSARSFGIQVRYEGQCLGWIRGEEVFDQALQDITQRLAVSTGQDHIADPEFSFGMLQGQPLMDQDELAAALVEHTDSLCEAYGLFVNGQLLTAAAEQETLRAALDGYLDGFLADTEQERAAFVGDVTIEDGLYPTAAVDSPAQARAEIAAGGTDQAQLRVKVIREETYEEEIPFSTVEIPDETHLEDYRKTQVAGVNGVAAVTAQVTYVDGREVERKVISSQVVTPPVDQQELVGTMTISQYEEQQALAAAQMAQNDYELEWPVGGYNYISSYFGDDRGHKGYDIAAQSGTPIYAAEAGEVVSINSSGSAYGLHFVVDHGNGLQTLYAHCSSIDVSVGQRVARGETIAAVGRTGRATGNHLHFEVWEDGYVVNPSGYFN